ncbi:MAG: formate dehydrogenase accessory sulfurtransferase FdhD [Methanospirillum sp.]
MYDDITRTSGCTPLVRINRIVWKCLRARIPLIVSRGATTTLAVGLAENRGLAIIGSARTGRTNIYTHPERIAGAPVITERE